MTKEPGYEPWKTIENLMPGMKKAIFMPGMKKSGFHTRHEKKKAVFMPVLSMDAYA